uniref:Choline/carnitine acyltransferase domain-containing protein n=1 Tax=Poecilia reticulata TaxID=8081 RepID=A0A3P9NPA4_POERE
GAERLILPGFRSPSVGPVSATRVAGRYLSHQRGLPSLPVPPLQQTCERYLTALEPIVEAEELSRTRQLVQQFQEADGVGQRLQRGLERRARDTENWVRLNSNCN